MKNIYLLFAFIALYCTASAQKYVPLIKTGTTMVYDAFPRATGDHVPVTLTVLSLDYPVKIKWDVAYYGSGVFEMSKKALENSEMLIARQPDPDIVTKIADDQTLIVLSKSTFNTLIKDKTFMLNGIKFLVKESVTPYKINNKEADVFYAASENGKKEVWILNNPAFPLICMARKFTKYIDFSLTSIKE